MSATVLVLLAIQLVLLGVVVRLYLKARLVWRDVDEGIQAVMDANEQIEQIARRLAHEVEQRKRTA